MFWVVEKDIFGEERYGEIFSTLSSLDYDYTEIKTIPFTKEMSPNIWPLNPVIAIGSVKLTETIAYDRKWIPGGFKNENFDYQKWATMWKGLVLNEMSTVHLCSFDEVPNFLELSGKEVFFIRPLLDNKAFPGHVTSSREYQKTLMNVLEGDRSDLQFNLKENVLIADPKSIYREVRFFIVDGEIITHSTYKVGERINYMEEVSTDSEAISVVQEAVNRWTPSEAFVLDVALTNEGYKIIELNCLTSCGFYKANVSKIVQSLAKITEKYYPRNYE